MNVRGGVVPTNRLPTHPGEMLLEGFLKPRGITRARFAARLGISPQRLNELVRGKRGVTPEMARLLAEALGTSPDVWLNLQAHHDLAGQKKRANARKGE